MTLTKEIICMIKGKPISKARHRMRSTETKKIVAYDSQKSEKDLVKIQMKSERKAQKPMEGELCVNIVFTFKKPRTVIKNKLYHTVKPDIDNLLKFYLDAGNGILWYDDRHISEISAKKVYGKEERTYIEVTHCEN